MNRPFKPAEHQTLAIGMNVAQSLPLHGGVIRVVGDAACTVTIEAPGDAGIQLYLPANFPEYLDVKSGSRLAVVWHGINGRLNVISEAVLPDA